MDHGCVRPKPASCLACLARAELPFDDRPDKSIAGLHRPQARAFEVAADGRLAARAVVSFNITAGPQVFHFGSVSRQKILEISDR
jgi:hypothetical protein